MDRDELLRLLKLGATFKYREPTEEEKKDRILTMHLVLPGNVKPVNIKCEFQND